MLSSEFITRKSLLIKLNLFVIVMLASAVTTFANTAQFPEESWYGIVFGESRLGYTKMLTDKTTYKGAEAYKTQSDTVTKLVILGTEVGQTIRTITYSDSNWRPVYQYFQLKSGGKETVVEADFFRDKIECKIKDGSGASKKTLAIPEGAMLVGDAYDSLAGESKPKVGDAYERLSFNALTITLDKVEIKVLKEDTIKHDGQDVKTLVVLTKTPMMDLTSYQTLDTDQTLRIETTLGMNMVRMSREEAMGANKPYTPPQDFAIATSIKSDIKLPDPGVLHTVNYVLKGIPDQSYIISDERQAATSGEQSPYTVSLVVTAAFPNDEQAVDIPIDNAALREFLGADLNIKPGDETIVAKVREVVGKEKNAVRAALKIRDYVRNTMKPSARVGLLRPGPDILKDPMGVCRDYAILYASLARSAGIPTRIAGGLIWSRNGFYYHAWNEIWTGGYWMPVDATLPYDHIDPTHIKLTQGSSENMYKMTRIIGQLDVRIEGYVKLPGK